MPTLVGNCRCSPLGKPGRVFVSLGSAMKRARRTKTRKPARPTVAKSDRFPLRGSDYRVVCDGAPLDDGTYTIRVLIAGIQSQSDARRAAVWLRQLITARMPKAFRTADGEQPARAN